MSRKLVHLSFTAALVGSPAMADVPDVAVDIAPVHSLVARVMDGVGTPDLIVQPGASPHEYSLRPSEAAALQNADLVFWMGKDLTPWMTDAVETLSKDAAVVTLLETEGTILLDFREGAMFEAHAHGDGSHEDHGDEHDHDHDDHGHGHDEEHGHDDDGHDEEHGHDHDEHEHGETAHGNDSPARDHDDHGHAHGSHDPHAWLSPENAMTWLNLIAAQLSTLDPDNAGAYFTNAAAAGGEMEALSAEVSGILDPFRGGSFIVFHDAYQYFEMAFDFPAAGAISLGDATDPGPARIAEIRSRILEEAIDCVLAEPQYNPDLVATVLAGTDANTGVIDPLGAALEPGPDLYPQVIRNLATTLAECL